MCVCYCVAATQSCEVQACFELVVHIHHTDGRTNGHLEVLSLLTEAENKIKDKDIRYKKAGINNAKRK